VEEMVVKKEEAEVTEIEIQIQLTPENENPTGTQTSDWIRKIENGQTCV